MAISVRKSMGHSMSKGDINALIKSWMVCACHNVLIGQHIDPSVLGWVTNSPVNGRPVLYKYSVCPANSACSAAPLLNPDPGDWLVNSWSSPSFLTICPE